MTDYSRGDYADLPAGTTDLENNYTAPDLTAIASNDNSTYAEQTANDEIAIHQYKKTVTGQYTNITWSGKSSLAPSESPVIMEVYNVDLTAWEELDRDDSTAADTDFDIIYNNLAVADYLDTGVITWRVYQAASSPALVEQDSFTYADVSPLPAPWLTLNACNPFQISFNRAVTTSTNWHIAYWDPSVNAFSENQSSQVSWVATAGNYAGPAVRLSDGTGHTEYTHGIAALIFEDTSIAQIWHNTGSGWAQLGSDITSITADTGDIFKLSVSGTGSNNVTLSRQPAAGGDFTVLGTATSGVTGGQPGIAGYGAGVVDNWEGRNI